MEQKTSSSRAFFLELVLDLVIFVICAVICLQVFAQAHIESSRSAAQSQLGIEAQLLAENFKAGYQDTDSLAARMGELHGVDPQVWTDEGSMVILKSLIDNDYVGWFYDRDLQLTNAEEATYCLCCSFYDTRSIRYAVIMLYDREDDSLLLSYPVGSYTLRGSLVPQGGDG